MLILQNNSIWPVDVSDTLGSNHVSVYGFDISNVHYPPRAWLPAGVRLLTHDVKEPLLDESLRSTFDIVHLRWWFSQSKEEVTRLLERAGDLLSMNSSVAASYRRSMHVRGES